MDTAVRAGGAKLSAPPAPLKGPGDQVARGESRRLVSLVMLLNIKQNYFVVVCISFTAF